VSEKLVAQPFTLAGTRDQTGNVDEFKLRRRDLGERDIVASVPKRSSGTGTRPTLGSIVQKGKFAAAAVAEAVSALNSVDLPTLGRPTMPQLNPTALVRHGFGFAGGAAGLGLRRLQRERNLAHVLSLVTRQ